MKIAAIAAAVAFVAAPVFARSTGGWSRMKAATDSDKKALTDALGKQANYEADVKPHCFKAISAIQTQVVAGTNTKYHVVACKLEEVDPAGECTADPNCPALSYEIVVFTQPWTSTTKVTSAKVQW
ncbi:TPA: hypothetical protein N0F65_008783 [Lagenidium giganteum]|uniref:Cystatin domain-containing protein n=1 Tax=Lagenidium giganteum TaxID=4803 RepID=A0AAV2YVH0_9STRA|nr:TPA: hypothetical protein N0F65_008783 [Lagenidium giganteum]